MTGSDVFCLKIALLANAGPVPVPNRLQVLAEDVYNPIDITLGLDFNRNPSLLDKGKLLPDKGMCPFNITEGYV